jgi:hypothetical protein
MEARIHTYRDANEAGKEEKKGGRKIKKNHPPHPQRKAIS